MCFKKEGGREVFERAKQIQLNKFSTGCFLNLSLFSTLLRTCLWASSQFDASWFASSYEHLQVFTVSLILSSVQSLLADPNPASPANPDAAALLTNDPKAYRRRARRCAERSLDAGFGE